MKITRLTVNTIADCTILQFSAEPHNTLDYLSAAKGMKEGYVLVEEVSMQGDVNSLLVTNKSQYYIFFMDGEFLIGAKQNRVLNTSILLAPETTTKIPVSCVERGRWSRQSAYFAPSEFSLPSEIREKKSRSVHINLKRGQKYESNQGEVWREVDSFHSRKNVRSQSGNIEDSFMHRRSEIQDSIKKIKPAEGANGFAVFSGQKLRQVDIFNRSDYYQEVFERLMYGILGDRSSNGTPLPKPAGEEDFEQRLNEMLQSLAGSQKGIYPGVCTGEQTRYSAANLEGMLLEFNKQPVHLSVFAGMN